MGWGKTKWRPRVVSVNCFYSVAVSRQKRNCSADARKHFVGLDTASRPITRCKRCKLFFFENREVYNILAMMFATQLDVFLEKK